MSAERDLAEIEALASLVTTEAASASAAYSLFAAELLRPTPAMLVAAKAVLVAAHEVLAVATIGLSTAALVVRDAKDASMAWPLPAAEGQAPSATATKARKVQAVKKRGSKITQISDFIRRRGPKADA